MRTAEQIIGVDALKQLIFEGFAVVPADSDTAQRLRLVAEAEREACARIADRCADDETRKALGANAAINAASIASAIRNRQ